MWQHLLTLFDVVLLLYVGGIAVIYLMLVVLGGVELARFSRRRRYGLIAADAVQARLPSVSIIVPAYNEEAVIVSSIKSLMAADHPDFEVVIANDGSKDRTFEVVDEEYDLRPSDEQPTDLVPSKPITGFYRSAKEPRLAMVMKENGHRADALNAALRFATKELVLATDADTILEPQTLRRLARAFGADPLVIAAGGSVRIANGSEVRNGRVVDVKAPSNMVACFQLIEYLRAFLVGRCGWGRLQALVIISGALGMFKRDIMQGIGGYDPKSIGEDAELVMRMHMAHRGIKPYRMAFCPDAVCWTQAPFSRKDLSGQRNRWHRGLVQFLWKHKRMVGNPRYGVLGMVALPYFVLYEMLGPVVEIVGILVMAVLVWLDLVNWGYSVVLVLLSFLWGLIPTISGILYEFWVFGYYRRPRCLGLMLFAALVESVGHRQYQAYVRLKAFWTLWRGNAGWGTLQRASFESKSS